MLEKEPLVSIVTPFYNTDEYLAECIESVFAQTYQNWEYILVNNCSTDQSSEIAQSYVEKDKRVRLIHNKNFLTQVQNYNHALRQISSESKYCKIVQADDWMFPECVLKMVEIADNYPSVGIVSAYRLQGSNVANVGLCYKNKVTPGKEACRNQIINKRDFFGSPTSILIRSEILNNRYPFYDENHLYEDTEACFEIMEKWDFGFVHQILTYERTQDHSLSSNILRYDKGWILGRFIKIKKYGPLFLNNEEFKRYYSEEKNNYFSFIVENIFSGKIKESKEFLMYHKKGLATIGYRLSSWMLAKYIILELIDIVFNLKKTAGRVLKIIKS